MEVGQKFSFTRQGFVSCPECEALAGYLMQRTDKWKMVN